MLILKQLLLALEAEVDAVPLPCRGDSSSSTSNPGGGGGGVGRTGAWLLDLLAQHGVTCDTAELIVRRALC